MLLLTVHSSLLDSLDDASVEDRLRLLLFNLSPPFDAFGDPCEEELRSLVVKGFRARGVEGESAANDFRARGDKGESAASRDFLQWREEGESAVTDVRRPLLEPDFPGSTESPAELEEARCKLFLLGFRSLLPLLFLLELPSALTSTFELTGASAEALIASMAKRARKFSSGWTISRLLGAECGALPELPLFLLDLNLPTL